MFPHSKAEIDLALLRLFLRDGISTPDFAIEENGGSSSTAFLHAIKTAI